MAKRLVRAKQKIRNAGIPYRVPPAHLLPERTPPCWRVLYLLFNEGYAASAGADLVRQNLSAEAIRLARVLAQLMPDEPEARRAARADAAARRPPCRPGRRGRRAGDPGGPGPHAAGTPPRSPRATRCWRRRCGAGGPGRTRSRPPSRPATRPRAEAADTDWPQIAALYGRAAGSCPHRWSSSTARSRSAWPRDRPPAWRWWTSWRGPGELAGYHLLPATRADLLRRLGRSTEAAAAYREALELAGHRRRTRYLRREWLSKVSVRGRIRSSVGYDGDRSGGGGERTDSLTLLALLTDDDWDKPTLCAGWRVREVVAHITMPYRLSIPRFLFGMLGSVASSTGIADRKARRDAADLPRPNSRTVLRQNINHPWKPPGGGFEGALSHDVIHGLDMTVALGIDRRGAGRADADRPRRHSPRSSSTSAST